MGYTIAKDYLHTIFSHLGETYTIYAPKRFVGGGTYSDTDRIRYSEVKSFEEIEWTEKSEFSFKEVLTPISDTLFYFTEKEVKEADAPVKGAIVFLRSCDLHAVKRLDEMYLNNGQEDYYYKRLRDKVKFVLMGCDTSYENCFCVSMGTNTVDTYDAYMMPQGESLAVDSKWEVLTALLADAAEEEVTLQFVTENKTKVRTPENITLAEVADLDMWEEYKQRCIGCGRCNFVCPTCTCFTMQDIYYAENGKVGERRRVWASCMVDGYTDMAGGHGFRGDNGQRMRFKVMHKVHDYKERFGYHMCVGCGRCDDVCPEYISFANCIHKVSHATKGEKIND